MASLSAPCRPLMTIAVADCLVTGFEPLIDGLTLPDVDDRRRGPGPEHTEPCYLVTQERPMEEWIVTTPGVLGGKPCIKGTRISVEHVLELLAGGASREDIVRAFPQITSDGLTAALVFAARSMKNEVVWDLKIPA